MENTAKASACNSIFQLPACKIYTTFWLSENYMTRSFFNFGKRDSNTILTGLNSRQVELHVASLVVMSYMTPMFHSVASVSCSTGTSAYTTRSAEGLCQIPYLLNLSSCFSQNVSSSIGGHKAPWQLTLR